MVKITIKMTRKALFQYLLGYTYKSFSGISGLLIGFGILVWGLINLQKSGPEGACLYIIMGVFLTAYTPLMLWVNAGKQLKRNFSHPLVYTLEDDRILVEMNQQQAEYDWKDMRKVTRSAGNLLVHTGYRNAFIWPIVCINDQYDAVVEKLKQTMGQEKVKIK